MMIMSRLGSSRRLRIVLSKKLLVLCRSAFEDASPGQCQSKTTQRERAYTGLASGGKSSPLVQRDRAVELEIISTVEMAFLVEVIVD